MELWRIYKFVKFVKKQEDNPTEYQKLKTDYAKQQQLNSRDMDKLWLSAIKEGFISVDDGTHAQLNFKGRQLTEMKGYGFLCVALEPYSRPILVIAALVGLVNLLVSIF